MTSDVEEKLVEAFWWALAGERERVRRIADELEGEARKVCLFLAECAEDCKVQPHMLARAALEHGVRLKHPSRLNECGHATFFRERDSQEANAIAFLYEARCRKKPRVALSTFKMWKRAVARRQRRRLGGR